MAEIRIGTSGWHYKHWIGTVYPSQLPTSQMLSWYQERFDTVELNNTFYRLPTEAALETWRSSVTSKFRFAVKGSRFLTHMKKLKDPADGIAKFFTRIDLLKARLGPILFQLPPHFAVNPQRLSDFLEALPPGHRYAFEFRDPTWNTPAIFDLLHRRRAAYCPFHLAGYQSPVEITTDFTYIRLHGPGGKYQGSYGDEALRQWAIKIQELQKQLRAIYVYFDNDEAGYAARDAMRLREMVAAHETHDRKSVP